MMLKKLLATTVLAAIFVSNGFAMEKAIVPYEDVKITKDIITSNQPTHQQSQKQEYGTQNPPLQPNVTFVFTDGFVKETRILLGDLWSKIPPIWGNPEPKPLSSIDIEPFRKNIDNHNNSINEFMTGKTTSPIYHMDTGNKLQNFHSDLNEINHNEDKIFMSNDDQSIRDYINIERRNINKRINNLNNIFSQNSYGKEKKGTRLDLYNFDNKRLEKFAYYENNTSNIRS